MSDGRTDQPEIFTIKATRCKRCGGILLSEFGLKNGMGHVCKRKTDEEAAAAQIDENQCTHCSSWKIRRKIELATNKQTVGAFAVLGIFGAILFLTSCHNAPQEPTSDFVIEEQNYTSYEEKPLTSENSCVSSAATETSEPEQQKPLHYEYTDAEADMLARLVLREAGGCSEEEQRLVVWTVFQRVDSTSYDFRNMNTITDVVTAPYQFAYDETAPIKDNIRRVCAEELEKWANNGTPPIVEPYAPTLPYLFFEGDGRHNWFRAEW